MLKNDKNLWNQRKNNQILNIVVNQEILQDLRDSLKFKFVEASKEKWLKILY